MGSPTALPRTTSDTVPSPELATHTLPSPTATAAGPSPTLTTCVWWVAVSTDSTLSSVYRGSHTTFPSTATPDGDSSNGTGAVACPSDPTRLNELLANPTDDASPP